MEMAICWIHPQSTGSAWLNSSSALAPGGLETAIETPSISNGLSGETKHDDAHPRQQRDETPGYETVGEGNRACARSV